MNFSLYLTCFWPFDLGRRQNLVIWSILTLLKCILMDNVGIEVWQFHWGLFIILNSVSWLIYILWPLFYILFWIHFTLYTLNFTHMYYSFTLSTSASFTQFNLFTLFYFIRSRSWNEFSFLLLSSLLQFHAQNFVMQ